MKQLDRTAVRFPRVHRLAILEVGSHGASDDLDLIVMSELLALGIIEKRQDDRVVVLTESGQRVYAELVGRSSGGQGQAKT